MAQRGSAKWRSVEHEEFIEALYSGRRSPSSGASDTDQGDVRTARSLIECKVTGDPSRDPKTPTIIKHLEKVAREAWSEGRDPAVALRYFDPESPLADNSGWIDVVLRPAHEDSVREEAYASVHENQETNSGAESPLHCQGPEYCEFCGAN